MSINKEVGIRSALLIQFGSKYANVAIQLVITAILARLLTPEEFGLVAIVTVFTSFFSLLSTMGIEPAIVQYRDLSDDDISALFIFSGLFGLLLTVFFCLLAMPLTIFYNDNRLLSLLLISSPTILLNTLNMVPSGILLREKHFISIGIRFVVATLFSGICAVCLAYCGFGAASIIIQSIILSFIYLIWNLVCAKIKIGSYHFKEPLKRILRYSLFHLGFSTVNFFSRNLDNLLIGRFLGSTVLGFYDKAYKLSIFPNNYISSIVGSVLQPYLSEYQTQPSIIFTKWLQIVKALSLIAMPIAVISFCCSKEIILLYFGEQWFDSICVFQVLCTSMYFQIVNNPCGAIFQSTGRTDYMFYHTVLTTAMTITLLIAGLCTGDIFIVSICIAVAYILHTFSLLYFLIWKVFNENVFSYVKHFVPEIITGAILMFTMSFLMPLFSDNLIISLCEKCIIVIVGVLLSYAVFKQYKYLKVLKPKGRKI